MDHQIDTINLQLSKRGILLLAGVGTGKTFIYGGVLRRLRDIVFHKQIGCIAPWPYIVVTKASIVEQTKRVLELFFNLKHPRDVMVINIDQLRSKFGELFVEEQLIVEHGEEHRVWKWRPDVYPCVIVWDECQILKNSTSIQHDIATSYNDLPNTWQIFSSATPFTRVSEAKCFCVSTRIPQKIATFQLSPLDNAKWPMFAKSIAAPAEPIEHSPAAIDRLTSVMDEYIVRVKGVKAQFNALNEVKLIKFTTEEGRKYYEDAVERYRRRIAKAESNENLTAGERNIIALVAFLQYRIAAESNPDRIRYLVDNMYEQVTKYGKAACCAVNFKQTIIRCVKYGNEKYGIPRSQISLIWGGGTKQPTKKQQAKQTIESDNLIQDAFKKYGITMDDINLGDDEVEAFDETEFEQLPPDLRLGAQSLKERQSEIDRFQKGKTLYCFYTFKSGGVGLSLHHTDEFTKEKVRRKKESGFAFEEDIPKITTRPRVTLVAPTWSAIEMVQGLGRAPRITSLSDTNQMLIFFAGTVEERVARVVSVKLRCLSKVVRQKESWEGVIIGKHYEDEDEGAKLLTDANAAPTPTEESQIFGDIVDDENGVNGK